MKFTVLHSVPETMLWTLHNRAVESLRPNGIIKDEKCEAIYSSLVYDYKKNFGNPEPSHAIRSLVFDEVIAEFLSKHPKATVVNLGEGLETQRFRFPNNQAAWISVDVPEAIEIREQFIEPDQQHIHCPVSATDIRWFDYVSKEEPVIVTAQGLFMYFKEEEVINLIKSITTEFKSGIIVFDTIPKWLSKKTLSEKGWQKTNNYTTPPMPWGIDRNEIISSISSWSEQINNIEELKYVKRFPRGYTKWLFPLLLQIPVLKNKIPTAVKLSFGS